MRNAIYCANKKQFVLKNYLSENKSVINISQQSKNSSLFIDEFFTDKVFILEISCTLVVLNFLRHVHLKYGNLFFRRKFEDVSRKFQIKFYWN